jgi:SAM-dependent methyltransferase
MDLAALEHLLTDIGSDPTYPIPPAPRIFTGGDATTFKQYGLEALRSMVIHAGVKPDSRVLEIGCGIGRVAVPLTYWLKNGTYVGTDIVLDGVQWCRENISARHKNFSFLHNDIYNEYYNPDGKQGMEGLKLPFANASFDVVLLFSVFTHLNTDDVRTYLPEIRRVLAPDGRLWATWFMVDKGIGPAILDGRAKIHLTFDGGDGAYYANDNRGTVSVAVDEELIWKLHTDNGFRIKIASRGDWCQPRTLIEGGFQDLIIAEKIS